MRLCRPPPRRVTSASSNQCPCQESNLVYDLRRVACVHHTPRTEIKRHYRGLPSSSLSVGGNPYSPPRNRTSPDCFEGSHASSTPAGHHSISRPGIEPGPGPSESPMQSATSKDVRRPKGRVKDIRGSLRLQEPTTGFAPACFRLQDGRLSQSSHVGSQHEREDSNPIQRLWRPPALPGARSCKAAEPFEKDSAAIVIHPTRQSSTPR